MKLSLGDLLVPALLLGAAGWWGYHTWSDHAGKARAEVARQNESAEYERAVSAMAARHNATPALTARLAQGGHTYTYNVQNALLAATGRAVTFGAVVTDLEKHGDAYVLDLDDASAGPPVIRYALECDGPTARKFMGSNPPVTHVMVAATIASVDKADPSGPGDAGRYLARGRCLELVAR